METAEFKSKVMSDVHVKFREHSFKVRTQYREVKRLNENRPSEHLLVQMDFAENYGCTASIDAVQSSYWNQEGVTLDLVSSITKMRML